MMFNANVNIFFLEIVCYLFLSCVFCTKNEKIFLVWNFFSSHNVKILLIFKFTGRNLVLSFPLRSMILLILSGYLDSCNGEPEVPAPVAWSPEPRETRGRTPCELLIESPREPVKASQLTLLELAKRTPK